MGYFKSFDNRIEIQCYDYQQILINTYDILTTKFNFKMGSNITLNGILCKCQ